MKILRFDSVAAFIRVGVLACALAVGSVGVAADAQAQPSPVRQAAVAQSTTSMTSGIQVQNLSTTSTANVQVSYYNQDGSPAASQTFQVSPNASYNLYGSTLLAPVGFGGSAVVSADQPIAAITNLITSSPTMGEAYDGIVTASTNAFVPLFQQANSGYNSTLYVQNTSTSTSTTANVTFSSPAQTVTKSYALNAAGSIAIDASNDGLSGTFVGSATVTASQPLAVEVNQTNNVELFAYTGSSAGSSTVYAPLIMTSNHGYSTGLQVQNVDPSLTTTVSLYLNGNSTAAATATLSPGQSVPWYPVPGTTPGFVGSATVKSSNGATLLGAVNELASSSGQGMTYNMFGSGTQTVNMPLVMFNNHGYYTGEQVQNVGASAATVDFKINGQVVDTQVIQPGQSYTWYSSTQNLIPGGGTVAAGTASAREGGSQIVGIVNEITSPQTGGDTSFAYEGFNQ